MCSLDTVTDTIRTKVPARMDRLPWSRWHWLMISALGVVWILDGLEVTIKGAIGPTLKSTLGFSNVQVGGAATIYLLGAVVGAAFGGWATDRWGRKRVFIWTILIYLVGVLGTGLVANGYLSFAIFRTITGLGIGGEYAGIHSAIDELLPARVRGRVALAINGSYWIGTLLGSGLAQLYLNTLPASWAWRAAFLTGAVLAVGVLMLRAFVPESPRWLMVHGHAQEADEVVSSIERKIEEETGEAIPEPPAEDEMELVEREPVGPVELTKRLFRTYPRRSFLGGTLMTTQAFLYNAIFFTYGLVLTTYFGVGEKNVGLYLIPFAIGNFTGPVVLGPYFDKWGRKPMISGTYFVSAALLSGLAFLFVNEMVNGVTFTLGLTIIFFFASAAASSAYMTVSETFPLELRAQAIGFFYIVGTAAGGVVGPWLFGNLINADNRVSLLYGYMIGAGLMVIGGLVELWLGFAAEQKSLEEITDPLSAILRREQRTVLSGPLGLDPSNAEQIRGFQARHDIDEGGTIGPKTMGALRAALAESDDGDRGDLMVDVTDPEDVRRFQERFGLPPTGEVDPETQGAMLALDREPVVDPTDAESVRRFQRNYALEADGIIGPLTQAALQAVQAARDAGVRSESLDPINPASVRRFQHRYQLNVDGEIGARTRGALMALRGLEDMAAGVDVTDADAIRAFQRDHGLEADGAIGDRTRAAMADECRRRREERAQRDPAGAGRPEFDPAEVESIRRFQREYDLERSGHVGEDTVAVLRDVRVEAVGVDATDPDSIRRFQREHDLEPDGVIGPATQGAIAAAQERMTLPDPEAEPDEPEMEALRRGRSEEPAPEVDPADPESVRTFQQEHGLEPTGTVDRRTQVALRAIEIERERQAEDGNGGIEGAPGESAAGRPYSQRGVWSGFTYVASTPAIDRDLGREIHQITEVLEHDGAASRSELRERVNARRWGPGRFRHAFSVARDEDRIVPADNGRWRVAPRAESVRS